MAIICRSATHYQVEIVAGTHKFIADEPLDVGDDLGPTPYDLLLGALGACTVMTVQMYSQRKGWPLHSVEVSLDTTRIYARDCEECVSTPDTKVELITRQIRFIGDLTAEQITRLTEIADRCPVHRTLTGEITIRTTVTADLTVR